ncbi:CAM kinase, SNF1 family [Cryptosporidium felis]|nr:CAM kinase, SNF1 family [Cryptosporidium felis]
MICEVGEGDDGNYVVKGVESYKKSEISNSLTCKNATERNPNPNSLKYQSKRSSPLSSSHSHSTSVSLSPQKEAQGILNQKLIQNGATKGAGYHHNESPGLRSKEVRMERLTQSSHKKLQNNCKIVNNNSLEEKTRDYSDIVGDLERVSLDKNSNNKSTSEAAKKASVEKNSKLKYNHSSPKFNNSAVSPTTPPSKNRKENSGKISSSASGTANASASGSGSGSASISSLSLTNGTLNNINKAIEVRRKYYVKVTPINTKYIAVVKTVTNNTPLLLCFEHGKDRHPKEIINLKNSNIYKGVTEKGPCICIRPKNESKYKTIEIISNGDNGYNDSSDGKKKTQIISSNANSSKNSSSSQTKEEINNSANDKIVPKISSNSVGMYEVECHSDFDLWCNFFTNIGISLCNFRSLFHTTKLIGEGSFAKVYKGKNVITGEDVVLKAVDKKKVKESNVYTEIEVLRRVHHPHIVHFIASFEEEDHVCLVLEFLGGGELFEWIAQKGAYSEEQAKIAMKRVLLALQWLHANNVVHRDLKTENLILEHRNSPESLKIIDFGLAASLGSSAMKMRCGSPGYVAPEILEDKIYSTKVDVFSIGVVLYTLLGGSPPFPGSNMKEILKKNIQGNVQFTSSRWKNISSSVKDLIKWMMAKDPESRCSASQAIYHPWFEKIPLNHGFFHTNANYISFQSASSPVNGNNGLPPEQQLQLRQLPSSSSSSAYACDSNKNKLAIQDGTHDKETKNNNYSSLYSKIQQSVHNNNSHLSSKTSSEDSAGNYKKNLPIIIKADNGKSSVSISSLEYTDSQFSSSINSMKISPRSNIIITSSSQTANRKPSIGNSKHLNANLIHSNYSYCNNSSNNNSMGEKLSEEEENDDDDDDDNNKDFVKEERAGRNKGYYSHHLHPQRDAQHRYNTELNNIQSNPTGKRINTLNNSKGNNHMANDNYNDEDDELLLYTRNNKDKKNHVKNEQFQYQNKNQYFRENISKLEERESSCFNSSHIEFKSSDRNHISMEEKNHPLSRESESLIGNFHSIYCPSFDDSISFERPMIGNIVTSSNYNNIKMSNKNIQHRTYKSNSIKTVLQSVFSRFSSNGNNNHSNSVSIGKKYEIN